MPAISSSPAVMTTQGPLPPTAGRVVVSGKVLVEPQPAAAPAAAPAVVPSGPAAALPLQQRATRVIRRSLTGSLRLSTPLSQNATGSFRLATPLSATPKVLWPGTPTPYPGQQSSSLSFGVSQLSQQASSTASPRGAAYPPQTTIQHPYQYAQAPMQVQHPYQYAQAPRQVMLPSGQIVTTASPLMMPGVQMSSPGGTTYQAAQTAGYMPMVYVPQQEFGSAPKPAAEAEGSLTTKRVVKVRAVQAPSSPGGSPVLTEAQAAALASGQLPSMGSAVHDGMGRCSPCAWFWKPRGCQSGSSCDYCHLCPEGELKNRKKAKIAAIKMGAVEPAHLQQGAAPQRAYLKLSTLL